jgi:hypothetical protein
MSDEAERLRRARLGSALRENLKRRKAQARGRSEAEITPAGEAPEVPPPAADRLEDDQTPGRKPGD